MAKREEERRLAPRIAGGVLQVEYVIPSPKVRDISVTGIYLLDPYPLLVGQPVNMRLQLGANETILVGGMVRRVDPGTGMAVEFIRLDAADRRRLKDFIARAAPAHAPAKKE